MNLLGASSTWCKVATQRTLFSLALVALIGPTRTRAAISDAGWHDVSLAEYQQHLEQLEGLVTACQQQRALKSPAPGKDDACDPSQVGKDDRVRLPGGLQARDVRYDWLRSVLARAGSKGGQAQTGEIQVGPARNKALPSVDELLTEARTRLQNDVKQVANPAQSSANYAGERQTLNRILLQRAYRTATEVSARDRFREWLFNQIDRFFESLARLGSRSPWIGWLLLGLLITGICVGLVWAFLRIERSARVKLIPDEMAPVPGAPSAREWQLWLKDAQVTAARGEWRDAIHFVYWAAIARLESRRMWPTDRARTPREYLGLVPGADPRKPALTALTQSFERTWYGGRAAASADFNAALKLAASLGVKSE